jgi:predicted AlkP superfamily pyrophosphatase or phosphodiesterase
MLVMILSELENEIEKERKEGEFIYPFYEKYCFSNISSTILNFFGIKSNKPILPPELHKDKLEIENSSKVILLLIDGLGYKQWLGCYKNYKFFEIFTQNGIVAPITTVFPSSTAAALTTINTGLTPQQHALLEWFLYFKEIDMIIKTLPFEPLYDKDRNIFSKIKADQKILFKGTTIYQTLKRAGIKSFTFINENYANSTYSKLVYKGSSTIPFINSSDLVVRLRKTLELEKGPAYFYVYIDYVDSLEHKYGNYTEEYYAEISVLSFLLKKELLEKIDKKVAKETLFLITADHGQLNILPQETVYLNKFKKVVNSFQKSKRNKPILPTGSPRDVFLHIKQDRLEEIYSFLSKKLREKAKVVKTEEAIKMNLFGIDKPSKEFYDRVGNLLILPYKNNTVWYQHIKGRKFNLLGHHGGLTKDEMLVPFAISKLSNLI